jgi:hypothetical protein
MRKQKRWNIRGGTSEVEVEVAGAEAAEVAEVDTEVAEVEAEEAEEYIGGCSMYQRHWYVSEEHRGRQGRQS